MIRFTFPYPPSQNALYRSRVLPGKAVPIVYKTADHKMYMAAVGSAIRRAVHRDQLLKGRLPLKGNLRVSVRLYRPQKRGDIDNPIKALFDALNAKNHLEGLGGWEDDSQVTELHVVRFDDKVNPRVEIELTELVEMPT